MLVYKPQKVVCGYVLWGLHDPWCHPERSEGSRPRTITDASPIRYQMLRFAQHDKPTVGPPQDTVTHLWTAPAIPICPATDLSLQSGRGLWIDRLCEVIG